MQKFNEIKDKVTTGFSDMVTKVKDFITSISKQSQSVMKHNYKNDISYFTISKVYYSTTMPNISVRILNENDIIKYKFNTTKDLYTKCAVKYNYDYGKEDFAKT